MKKTKWILAAVSAALLLGGAVLLFKDDAAQKMSDSRMDEFQPNPSVLTVLDEFSIQTETTDGTQTTEATAETLVETNSDTSTTESVPFVTSETLPAEVMQELTAQAEELNNTYPDAIGWLYIPGTNINYPIMQSADNDFYLHHAPDGRSLKAGSVFLDFRCENRFMNGVNIVYAHNMNNGSMFAGVTKFKDAGYFDSHRYGWLATSETVYRIDFFSAAVVDRYDSLYDGSVLSADWFPHLAEVSTIYEASEFSDTDRFISLSTCSYEFENARTVLTGKLTEMESDVNE